MTKRAYTRLARGLGWFSIGLGLAEVLAPDEIARLIGVRRSRGLLRLYGAREIANGVGILIQSEPVETIWARVAGDALDLASLGVASASPKSDRNRLLFATASIAGVTGVDVYCALKLSAQRTPAFKMQSVTVNRPPEEVYRFWRDCQNFPRFMSHVEEVSAIEGNRTHWVVKAPAGAHVEWDAEITEDRPNERIAWRSLAGADIKNSGWVDFRPAPGGRGAEVHAHIEYSSPGGELGRAIAALFGEEPEQQLKGDLCRFKQVMETGEVVHSDASISSGMHPGRPPEWFGEHPESQ